MTEAKTQTTICPDCKGCGMIRPPGEWASETCPRCDGSGEIPAGFRDARGRDRD